MVSASCVIINLLSSSVDSNVGGARLLPRDSVWLLKIVKGK